MLKIPPELDFTSEQFDPAQALAADNFYLPYPKAKIYDNLADWYSHAFNKKRNDILSNQESKSTSKNSCYVLKRNYEWYYETLGLDLPHDFDIQSRYKKYTKRKRNSNGKYQIDKKVVVKEMPSEMLEPMRSSKILIKRSDGSLKDFILVSTDTTPHADPTSSENVIKFKNSNSKEVSSTFRPDPKLINRKSELSSDSVCERASFSESELPYNAIQDHRSLSPRKYDSINLKKCVSLHTHSEVMNCLKDKSKSAVLPSTDEKSISALKESNIESPDFLNSGFSKIKLPNADKHVKIIITADNGNSNLNVCTVHLTTNVSDKTSYLKHKKTYSSPQESYSTNSVSVPPIKLQNKNEKIFNERKSQKSLVNLSTGCESINSETMLNAAKDLSSNTIACEVLNKVPDIKPYKCYSLEKVSQKKSNVKPRGAVLFNKNKGKSSKSKCKTRSVTCHSKIRIINNDLDVSTSPACVNATSTLELENNSSNLQAKHSENFANISSSVIKSPHNKGVKCKSDQSKSVKNESIMNSTENSNPSVKYISCITNNTSEVEKCDGINLETNSIPSVSNSTVQKKLPCEGYKIIKSKSATKPLNVLDEVKNLNTLNCSRKSFSAVEKLDEICNFVKNDCNLQENPVTDIDTLFNLQDDKDVSCKKNPLDAEVFNYPSTNETENSALVISKKSVSTCDADKAPNLEFKKRNSLSLRKDSISISSIILISPHDKENKHTDVKSVNSLNNDNEGNVENKNSIPESKRLFSPLKSLNKIPDIEFKKSDNSPKESHTDCYLDKSSIVKSPCNQGNTKELALLELARRARKRLHMQ